MIPCSSGRYEVRAPRGSGAMGSVYVCWDTRFGREVALKVIREAETPELRQRLKREAESLAAITHPGVARLLDAKIAEEGSYLVFELYEGRELGAFLADHERFTGAARLELLPIVLDLARQFAEALAAIHLAGIIHRDLKPSNILLVEADTRLVLIDFGIARILDRSAITLPDHIVGTPLYLSPEHALGEPTGPASDVYQFGLVLHQLLTGVLPFGGSTPLASLNARLVASIPPPSSLVPGLPPGVGSLVESCLDRDPARRPADGSALSLAMQRLEEPPSGPGSAPTPARPLRSTKRTTRRKPATSPPPGRPRKQPFAGILFIGLLMGAATLVAILSRRSGSGIEREVARTFPVPTPASTASPGAVAASVPPTQAERFEGAMRDTGDPAIAGLLVDYRRQGASADWRRQAVAWCDSGTGGRRLAAGALRIADVLDDLRMPLSWKLELFEGVSALWSLELLLHLHQVDVRFPARPEGARLFRTEAKKSWIDFGDPAWQRLDVGLENVNLVTGSPLADTTMETLLEKTCVRHVEVKAAATGDMAALEISTQDLGKIPGELSPPLELRIRINEALTLSHFPYGSFLGQGRSRVGPRFITFDPRVLREGRNTLELKLEAVGRRAGSMGTLLVKGVFLWLPGGATRANP